jgi:hypothetical protein
MLIFPKASRLLTAFAMAEHGMTMGWVTLTSRWSVILRLFLEIHKWMPVFHTVDGRNPAPVGKWVFPL